LRSGLPRDRLDDRTVEAVVEPINTEAKRIRLSIFGGAPWETFQVERVSMRLAYQKMGWQYAAFKFLVLALTLLLPPKTFYRMRSYYARRGLRHFRRFTGEPKPVASTVYSRASNARQ
jgi:hypothetical protein